MKIETLTGRKSLSLCKDVRNLILDYKANMEHHERYKKVMLELYYYHWINRPFWLCSIGWWIPM